MFSSTVSEFVVIFRSNLQHRESVLEGQNPFKAPYMEMNAHNFKDFIIS